MTLHTSRRALLAGGLATGGKWLFGCRSPKRAPAADAQSSARCVLTEPNIEGPYYLAGAPVRRKLAARSQGQRLVLSGRVLSSGCESIGGARLDVWHADHGGAYDLAGYAHRGVVIADPNGYFELETIVPGRYRDGAAYRPAHIHVKLHAAGHETLTTQLYFAGDPYNAGDPFIRPSLIMTPKRDGARLVSRFDFALAPA